MKSVTILRIYLLVLAVDVLARVTSEMVNPHTFSYLINHPKLCETNDTCGIRLLVMVFSAPHNFLSRMAIRKSWGLVASQNGVRRVFVLGDPRNDTLQEQITIEDDTYGDILQEDFADSFRNLTLKTVMIVKWATEFCAKAQFLLKIDDDCFLNPVNLFKVMDKIKNVDKPLITGKLWTKSKPYRNKEHKYYISMEDFPRETLPVFAAGPSYLYTRATFPILYRMSQEVRLIHLEDVYLNGLCAERADIRSKHNDKFSLLGNLNACDVQRSIVTFHRVKPWHFSMLWWIMHDKRTPYCKKNTKNVAVKRVNEWISSEKFDSE